MGVADPTLPDPETAVSVTVAMLVAAEVHELAARTTYRVDPLPVAAGLEARVKDVGSKEKVRVTLDTAGRLGILMVYDTELDSVVRNKEVDSTS